jgi:hypothetical protein
MTDEPTGSELVARHAELIGRVTLMWNDVHAQAGQLFQDFCASAEARKRYSETQNDRIKRQLLLSVGSVALEKYPDLRERLSNRSCTGSSPGLVDRLGPNCTGAQPLSRLTHIKNEYARRRASRNEWARAAGSNQP